VATAARELADADPERFDELYEQAGRADAGAGLTTGSTTERESNGEGEQEREASGEHEREADR